MATLLKIGSMYYSDLRMGGKRIRRALSPYKDTAEEKLADLVKIRQAKKHQTDIGDISWEFFKDKHRAYSEGSKTKGSSYYDKIAFRYLERTVGNLTRVSQVTPELLSEVQYKWIEEGKRKLYVNRLVNAIKAAMRKAEEWGISAPQKWGTVKEFKTTQARTRFFTIEELKTIIDEAPTEGLRTLAYLGGRAGLRLSEAFNLEWGDVDFKTHRLNITAHGNWNPKDFEKRFIPMSEDLEGYLKSIEAHRVKVLQGYSTAFSLGAVFGRFVRRDLHLKGTAHTLRHTFASHLVMNSVPVYTVSRLLGHATVQTTESHYAHLAGSHIDQAVRSLPVL